MLCIALQRVVGQGVSWISLGLFLAHWQPNGSVAESNESAERERDRETERQRDRETERQRDRETERQRGREAERQRGREAERERESSAREGVLWLRVAKNSVLTGLCKCKKTNLSLCNVCSDMFDSRAELSFDIQVP